MPITDSPLFQDFLAKNAKYANLFIPEGTGDAASAAELAAAQAPMASMPAPNAPPMLARSIASLGGNIATAISGNPQFMARDAAAAQQQDAQYAQALETKRLSDAENDRQQHQNILAAQRDAAMRKHDAALAIGKIEAAHQAVTQAQQAEDKRQKIGQDFQAGQNALDRQAAMDRQTAELAGRLDQVRAGRSRTGNPVLDKFADYTDVVGGFNLQAAQAYKAISGKDPGKDKNGFKKFMQTDPNMIKMQGMVDVFRHETMKPEPGQSAVSWGTIMRIGGFSEEEVRSAAKEYFPKEPDSTWSFEAPKGEAKKAGGGGGGLLEMIQKQPALMHLIQAIAGTAPADTTKYLLDLHKKPAKR